MVEGNGIRQSDMSVFRSCRQRWDFSSSLRRNLRPLGNPPKHLWFGTMMHAVMQDIFGLRKFASAHDCLDAVIAAVPENERADGWEEMVPLGHSMLTYFLDKWLPVRDNYRTLVVDGVPQVEISFSIPVEGQAEPFSGTFDRIVQDIYGGIWVLDYKFMRAIATAKLDNDFQVTHYIWAAQQLYKNVQGVVYLQFAKVASDGPEMLKTTTKDGRPKFSQAKSAPVTYQSYKAVLLQHFGEIPAEYAEHIHWLMMQEDADGDALIRWSIVRRGPEFLTSHEWNIRAQAREMLYPQLAIYPNPTAACQYCPFLAACIAVQDNADPEYILAQNFTSRESQWAWQENIVAPEGGDVAA